MQKRLGNIGYTDFSFLKVITEGTPVPHPQRHSILIGKRGGARGP